jgi:phosphatidylserine/phosphatidylglycerophosphate/cardiolipin synthase-like enzyme
VLAYNFTRIDIAHSRSFGLVTHDNKVVQEAVKLFEADSKRLAYSPGLAAFVVSPANARAQLAAFIKGAKKQLLIYDPEVSDTGMIRLLQERAKAGVEIRILGRVAAHTKLDARRMPHLRLHTRTIIRDGSQGFIGSQSLRKLELDSRREVGLIFRDPKIVGKVAAVFDDDWALTEMNESEMAKDETGKAARVAKKVAKTVARDLPLLTPMVEGTVREVAGENSGIQVNADELEETVRDAVKDAVKQAVREVVSSAK